MGRPGTECLNCETKLEKDDQYCPKCGQENSDQLVSLKTLMGDFLSNYFSLDSRLGRSMRHFFLHPGHLTNRFNEGKRVRHIHPLRLYLVITFLFFFVLSYIMTLELEESSLRLIAAEQNQPEISAEDSLSLARVRPEAPEPVIATDSADQQESKINFQYALKIMSDASLSDEMVMDSLKLSSSYQKDERVQLLVHQSRRVAQKDLDIFIPYVLKNLPVMMFILLPVFALYLMFLFRNKPNLYIRHIIHSLHIHSMVFLLLTLSILTGWFTGNYVFWITFSLITLYAFLSIRNVYRQSWMRTSWKFLLLGMFYFTTLFLFIFLEVGYSFLTF